MSTVNLGFREATKELFEEFYGGSAHLIPRDVVVTAAEFVRKGERASILPSLSHVYSMNEGMIFREDSFDPTSRIRRGRLYKKMDVSHKEFNFGGGHGEQVPYFASLNNEDIRLNLNNRYIALGLGSYLSPWDIVGFEATSSGEFLFTLKSRSNFGVIPDLDKSKLPENYKALIIEKVERVVSDGFSATPNSIIELCRDAASCIVSAVNDQNNNGNKNLDLSKALNAFKAYCENKENGNNEHYYNIIHCGKIIANLHNFNKSVKQIQNDKIRPIQEFDAQLGIFCLGQMLKDLNWTN